MTPQEVIQLLQNAIDTYPTTLDSAGYSSTALHRKALNCILMLELEVQRWRSEDQHRRDIQTSLGWGKGKDE